MTKKDTQEKLFSKFNSVHYFRERYYFINSIITNVIMTYYIINKGMRVALEITVCIEQVYQLAGVVNPLFTSSKWF